MDTTGSEMPMHDDDEAHASRAVVAIQRGAIAEVRREIVEIKDDANRLETRVDLHEGHIADLRERTARAEGHLDHLGQAYNRAATVATAQVMTDLEVRKTGAIAELKERGAAARHRRAIARELIFKGIAILMGVWAIVSSLIAARC